MYSWFILHSSKEAATMRVLGARKTLTQTILSLEQTLLSAIGLAIGVRDLLHAGNVPEPVGTFTGEGIVNFLSG